MDELYELKDKLMKELKDYAGNGKFSKDDVESIKYITSSIDHICNIVDGEEGYSGNYPYMGRVYDGRSYRGSYARNRDSMGRYSRENSMEGNSMDGSYDGMSRRMSRTGGNNVTDGLKELMYAAPAEMQGEINRLIKKLENM